MAPSTNGANTTVDPALAQWLPLDKTFGTYLLGTFLALLLYGLALHQAYKYYRAFRSDASFIRALVATVLTLETLQTLLTLHTCYFVFVTNYGHLLAALKDNGPWSLDVQPVVTSLTVLSAQIFFVRRVYEIGRWHRIAAASTVLFLVGQIGFATATSYAAFVVPDNVATTGSGWLLTLSMGMPLISDLILTMTLIATLSHTRSGLPRSNFLDVAITYVVNTGLLHCATNALAFACTIGTYNRSSFLYLFFNTVSTRVYANSFLCVLNSREALSRKGVEVFSDGQCGLNLIARAHRQATAETWNLPQVQERESPRINIHMTTEREESTWSKLGDASHMQTESRPESV
ncbi:hypothetical protein LXA43DRAFT_1102016 [Ganoderma leucocontextum]|nr:hypothetical protein LXA43DRAFT_1102016 [Ganoderma leucocontextum]